MAKREPPPEDPVPGPGPWVVSFNDCMTNLLCFFVMLVSFSSFEPEAKSKVTGAFQSISQTSLFVTRQTPPHESMLPPLPREFDVTERGSEKPTQNPPEVTEHPKMDQPPPQVNPYSDRVVVRLASASLFWGAGSALTPAGRQRLSAVAGFLAVLPGQVIVRELRGSSQDGSLDRAAAVAACLAQQARVPLSQCSVSSPPGGRVPPGEATIEVVLLKRRTFQWGSSKHHPKNP